MKLKIKKHAEAILIAIGYLENQMKHDPELKSKFMADQENGGIWILENYEFVKQLKMILGSIVEIPDMQF